MGNTLCGCFPCGSRGDLCPRLQPNQSFPPHTHQNTKYFTLNGERILAHVVYVYDGDTIHIVFPTYTLQGKKELRKWKCRLHGIDTPELRTHDSQEKEMGYFVKQQLHNRICNRTVYIRCGTFDKYGRLLITLETTQLGKKDDWIVNGEYCYTVNEWLVQMKYATRYDGGKKTPMDDLITNYIRQKQNQTINSRVEV